MVSDGGAVDGGQGAHAAPPGLLADAGGPSPHALQILSTEHWSLLSARSLGYTESMSRVSMFIAALTGSVVALALVSQATDFGAAFDAFALVLLPVVFFLGVVTIIRLGQINAEDAAWTQGMNRIRNAYLDLAPELEPYFVTSRYDDEAGILRSTLAVERLRMPLQGFVAVPGMVAVLDSVVAGATAAIGTLALGGSTGVVLLVGAVVFAATLAAFGLLAARTVAAGRRRLVVRFPSRSGVR